MPERSYNKHFLCELEYVKNNLKENPFSSLTPAIGEVLFSKQGLIFLKTMNTFQPTCPNIHRTLSLVYGE